MIGRNGIYIEPDLDYINTYIKEGEIANSAGDGKCGYTTRAELAQAYTNMLRGASHHGKIYNLHGPRITQAELAHHLNSAFGTTLTYRPTGVEEYRADRIAELGVELGSIISWIYETIRDGAFDRPSDFEAAAGRPHQSWEAFFKTVADLGNAEIQEPPND